jgi:hypothetical protein
LRWCNGGRCEFDTIAVLDKLQKTSSVEFRFLAHDEQLHGIPGVHVLVKQRPPEAPADVFFGGISVDTLFRATQPLLEVPYEWFGYRAQVAIFADTALATEGNR